MQLIIEENNNGETFGWVVHTDETTYGCRTLEDAEDLVEAFESLGL